MTRADMSRFAWLADAPLFIDAIQIERFYDAVIRPTYVEGATSVSIGSSGEVTFGGEVSGGGKLTFGGGLLKWLAGAGAEVNASAKATTGTKDGTSESRLTQWIPIRTPERQLTQLIECYNTYLSDRLLEIGPQADKAKADQLYTPATAATANRPRAMVILDLPGSEEAKENVSRLIPMAAELSNGYVKLLYNQLREVQVAKLGKEIEKGDVQKLDQLLEPLRPKSVAAGTSESTKHSKPMSADDEKRRWEQYFALFDPWDAMKVLEDATVQQRIRWIDFQMSCIFTSGRKNIHLHVCPGGEFDTGVFGYNFIYRTYKHGIRIVATLKSGPDLNVLVIYEK